ncbi:MAG: helix-turn-helix transcriptional regulator [Chloroflexia bacterium]
MTGSIGFGEQLRRFRVRAGLSLEGLGERAGLSPNAIGALERGRQRPYPHTIKTLADTLRLSERDRAILAAAAPRRVAAAVESPAPLPAPPPPPAAPAPSRPT